MKNYYAYTNYFSQNNLMVDVAEKVQIIAWDRDKYCTVIGPTGEYQEVKLGHLFPTPEDVYKYERPIHPHKLRELPTPHLLSKGVVRLTRKQQCKERKRDDVLRKTTWKVYSITENTNRIGRFKSKQQALRWATNQVNASVTNVYKLHAWEYEHVLTVVDRQPCVVVPIKEKHPKTKHLLKFFKDAK